MAPATMLVIADTEAPYTIMDSDGHYRCPHCQKEYQDEKAVSFGHSLSLGKSQNKKIPFSLLIHPDWLHGAGDANSEGKTFGGSVTDNATTTAEWNRERAKNLKLVEVRGILPDSVACPDTGKEMYTDQRGGTVPQKSKFKCQEDTCGRVQDVLTSIKKSGKSGSQAQFAIQGYCPECDRDKMPYGGRFFATANHRPYDAAFAEWENRKENDLKTFWPREEIPYGFMTHHNNGGIANHGYTHWSTMFNPQQLLLHTQLLKAISQNLPTSEALATLGVSQKYVQHDCMFCFWDSQQDCLAPHFSNNNFHPKQTPVQNNPFSKLGRGNWQSRVKTYQESLDWVINSWKWISFRDRKSVV